jgi:O-methyltransferase
MEPAKTLGSLRAAVDKVVRKAMARAGYDVQRREPPKPPPDLGEEFAGMYAQCREFTRTSAERMFAMYQATQYVTRTKVPGAIVECGVWRGGSCMISALSLAAAGDTTRELWLYDTYEGMSEPTEHDKDWRGVDANELLERGAQNKETSVWCLATLEDVEANFARTRYPRERVHFVKGKVEDTIPAEIPDQIALLRLDTDFYESTAHELAHLYPRIAPGGVLIIDDYGHWAGARKATDEFLAARGNPILLNRIDYTGRIAIIC